MTRQLVTSLYKVYGRKPATGWLYARQNFKPVFDGPSTSPIRKSLSARISIRPSAPIRPSAAPIGIGTSLDNQIPNWMATRLGITSVPDATAPEAAEDAFKRIQIPVEMREKIEVLLGSGSSLTITDVASDRETGEGTEFITTTVEPPKAG